MPELLSHHDIEHTPDPTMLPEHLGELALINMAEVTGLQPDNGTALAPLEVTSERANDNELRPLDKTWYSRCQSYCGEDCK